MKTRSAELISQRMVDLRRLVERDALRDTEAHFATVAFERDVQAHYAWLLQVLSAHAMLCVVGNGCNPTHRGRKRRGYSWACI